VELGQAYSTCPNIGIELRISKSDRRPVDYHIARHRGGVYFAGEELHNGNRCADHQQANGNAIIGGVPTMKFEIEDLGTYHVARFSGILDGSIRQMAADSVHPLIEDKESRILVDMSGVERLTSEAIAVFVTMVSRSNSKGSRIVFVNPSPFVHAIFEITKITKFLETYDSTEKGLERLLAPDE
jgi:anti-anti-sigma factor